MSLQTLIDNIVAAERGPKTCAVFDFDRTIISGYSATAFLKDQIARGEIAPADLIQLTQAATRFGIGSLGFSALMAVHAQYLAGRSEADYVANSERLFRRGDCEAVYPEARRLIRGPPGRWAQHCHHQLGHSLSGSASFQRPWY